MSPRQLLTTKYLAYEAKDVTVFTITLSTFVREKTRPPDEMFRHMWDQHVIHRIRRRLPVTARMDHDYVVELTPPKVVSADDIACFYGYHGFLAIEQRYAHRIWTSNGLNKHLCGALASFRRRGAYRPFSINSFLIEPVTNIPAWASYITKTRNPILPFAGS